MPVDPRLIEILMCPDCSGRIDELPDGGGLECAACGRIYPIRDGIPIMLVNEATPPRKNAP